MATDWMSFECMHCGKMFTRKWYELSRAFERVHFLSPLSLDEVEIEDSEGIGVFCSQECLAVERAPVMRDEGVPIPAVRPDIGPIESCAKCSGPVDMSDWHLTCTDGCLVEERDGLQILDVGYVAVVCRECAPRSRTEQAAVPLASQASV